MQRLFLLFLFGLLAFSARADDKPPLSGTLTIDQVQAAFMLSGNIGGGVLSFEGKNYDFTIGGLGVGGFGVSSIKATGEVYGLKSLADFPGAYAQARVGFAAGNSGGGDLWLENEKGVYMHLVAERKGLMLSLGADAIYIDLD